MGFPVVAKTQKSADSLPVYLSPNFNYSEFMRFDAPKPPMDLIYQSNGFLALRENGFGGQIVIIPAPVDNAPHNTSDRLKAMEIGAPAFVDAMNRAYNFADSSAERHVVYFPDRTEYQAVFEGGPKVVFTVYPVYGEPAAVLQVHIKQADGPLQVRLYIHGTGFQALTEQSDSEALYGSPRWPYRLLLQELPRANVQEDSIQWMLKQGAKASIIVTLGGTESEARMTLQKINASEDLLKQATNKAWNNYLASVPLVAPDETLHFKIGTSGAEEEITPEDLVRSELWFWRGVLSTTCQVKYLKGTPITIADWNTFMGMWGNDGIAEAIALSATTRKDLARGAILNWFRYSVNAHGDGSAAWTIFPSGKSTYESDHPEHETESVPLQAALVGTYVRLTGDTSILDEKPEGAAGKRTLWQSLVAYQSNLRKVRDTNQDHLIDWLHIYETGWDDKNSPFVDNNKAPTSVLNEQVFNLWSLQEMVYLSRIRGEDPSPWQEEFDAAREAVRTKLWDAETQRYWDLDISTGKLWTQGENLDAYYFLFYDSDPNRIAAMMDRLNDPRKFNGALLPTLAFDSAKWGGYWRGPAWPREFWQVALALNRVGFPKDAFTWLARAIQSNLGPILPENVDPKLYPSRDHINGGVRIMGYDALDCAAFADIAGLRIWAGDDLTVVADPTIGKVYVRSQKWMGDSYDALFRPGKPTLLWRNGQAFKPLSPKHVWRARKVGTHVTFERAKDIRFHRNPIKESSDVQEGLAFAPATGGS